MVLFGSLLDRFVSRFIRVMCFQLVNLTLFDS